MSQTTDWSSALAILGAGLVLGMMFVYFLTRRRNSAPRADLSLRDLEARRDALVEQLRAEVDAAERTRLELETARVLRAIDDRGVQGAVLPPPAPAPEALATRRAMMIGFGWGAGSMFVIAALAYFVMQAAQPRQEASPADPIAQLEQTVRRAPDDLESRLSLAQAYLERENLMGVFEQTQYILSKSPRDARALTYQALVRMAMGQQPEAVQMLQMATAADPNLLDAWVTLAWVHTQSGKLNEAEAAMQEAIRRRPDEAPRLQQVLAQMKAHRNVDMDRPAPTGATPVAPADDKAVRITLDLDPSARSRRGVIFITARVAGVSTGPPVAVKRVEASTLPVTFDFTSADSMMGQPLPARMRIEARLDADGDAMTRSPDDPIVAQDAVAAGSAVKLALK